MEEKIYKILAEYFEVDLEYDTEVEQGIHYINNIKINNIESNEDMHIVDISNITGQVTTDCYGSDLGAWNDFKKIERYIATIDAKTLSIISIIPKSEKLGEQHKFYLMYHD